MLPSRDVVLLGAGHTNAHVLRMWRMSPPADARLTLVTDFLIATYSGMLPGTLAGLYSPDDMEIDLVRLCAAAGARLIQTEVIGLDATARELICADRPPIPFDVLSVGIGSRTAGNPEGNEHVVPIKPMQTFLARLDGATSAAIERCGVKPLEIAVVGGGAGGVEIGLCLPAHLRKLFPEAVFKLALYDGNELLPGYPRRAQALAAAELASRGAELRLGHAVRSVGDGRLALDNATHYDADLVIWATGVEAPPLLNRLGLPRDDRGFLLARDTLQTIAGLPIFAVGDCASIVDRPVAKAGVYAVRQGPILWDNIRRQLNGEPLAHYKPQPRFLSALALGDARAIVAYKGVAFRGRGCWRLKDYIDTRFIEKYHDYRPMRRSAMPARLAEAERNDVMPCAGCGGKIGSTVLARVLDRLQIKNPPHVLRGLAQPDDAAVIKGSGESPLVLTADFFASFVDDPFLVGRVAALNALSDLFTFDAKPTAALALATIPYGPPKQQERLLYELLAGAVREFDAVGATLVGGHTLEGPQTTIGFSMLATLTAAGQGAKSGLRIGQQLVLTKPLGTGVLLAAQMRARCEARWFAKLAELLLTSNRAAARVAHRFRIAGMTDVTGFGLAGHLLGRLQAGNVAAEIRLEDVPLLPGVADLVEEGIESTLAPMNRTAERHIDHMTAQGGRRRPPYAALFDPQTSGGLVFGVDPEELSPLLDALRDASPFAPAVIGQVVPAGSDDVRITIV